MIGWIRSPFTRVSKVILGAALLLPMIAGAPRAGADETIAVFWIERDLSCGELTREVKTRYSGLGPYSLLPAQKKQEIRIVLDQVCGERFAACGFTGCGRSPAGTGIAFEAASAREPGAGSAEEELEDLLGKAAAVRRRAIETAEMREAREHLVWLPFPLETADGPGEPAEVDENDGGAIEADEYDSPVTALSFNLRVENRPAVPSHPDARYSTAAAQPAVPEIDLKSGYTNERRDAASRSSAGKYLPRSSSEFHRRRSPASISFQLVIPLHTVPQ